MTKLMLTKLVLILLIFCNNVAVSGVYKWTDADGKVHYSDKKMAQTNANELKLAPKATDEEVANSQQKLNDLNQQLEKSKKENAQKQEKEKTEAINLAKQKKKCLDASNEVEHIKYSRAVYYKDADNNKVYIDEQKRQEVASRYQKYYNENCR